MKADEDQAKLMRGKIGMDLAGLFAFPWVIVVMAILSGVILPVILHHGLLFWFGMALLFAGVGVALFTYARFPLYRQGKFLAWGSGAISPERRAAYRWAWRLVLIAVSIQLVLIGITR
ncbi:MAG: hypothetical protein NTV49_04700 [Kiritimatiellaeota bacterium]|nr:hypothetical protein [Kiritimatiellota bacterium]